MVRFPGNQSLTDGGDQTALESVPGLRLAELLGQRWQIWWWTSFAVCVSICSWVEIPRLMEAARSPAGIFAWFSHWNAESTLPLLVLLTLPVLIRFFRSEGTFVAERRLRQSSVSLRGGLIRQMFAAVVLFVISLVCSASIGWRSVDVPVPTGTTVFRFADLPPAYHDEFSYLLQARTFLAGRLAWPPMLVQPELFHQVHVLNQPQTASRYFPWTGLWIAPFERAGHPILGHWIAGGIACVCFFCAIAQTLSLRQSFLCGLLIALSPGISVFSNLLLSHHPTMMVLAVFQWAFFAYIGQRLHRYLWLAGIALSLGMLGRPMTAAGFALPYGLWFLYDLIVSRSTPGSSEPDRVPPDSVGRRDSRRSVSAILSLAVPLIAGFACLMVLNHSITGDWSKSAYQYYTDHWTPRHRYGFDNVTIGDRHARADNVMEAYDQWATNLTLRGAMWNVWQRLYASLLWSLGLIPMVAALAWAFPMILLRRADVRLRLIWMSACCLHLVHIPYWYDGILHWHYVFETAPLLLILTGIGLSGIWGVLQVWITPRASFIWTGALVAAVLLPGWIDADSLWGPSKVSLAVSEQSFSRVRMQQFQDLIRSAQVHHPALILIEEQHADPQLSYVINPPDLQSDVLVCRFPRNTAAMNDLREAFAERTFYRFDPGTGQLNPVAP